MKTFLQPLLFQLLDEVRDREAPPPLLHHYTDQSGLLGIVASREVFATEIRYLNDEHEYDHTLRLVEALFEAYPGGKPGSPDAAFWEAMRLGLSVVPLMKVFVASFSEHGDQLSQWRAYGARGGYSLGLSSDVLRSTAQHREDFCFLMKCIYDEERQRTILRDVLDCLLAHFREHDSDDWGAEGPGVAYGSVFATVVGMLAASFKDPGFAEESEWRLVVRHWGTDASAPKPEFRTGARNVVPFLRISLEPRGRSALESVRVGPSPNMPSAVQATEWLLAAQELADTTVDASAIPYRDW